MKTSVCVRDIFNPQYQDSAMDTRRRRLIIASSILAFMLVQGVQANPNHLEPIPPYDLMGIGYNQAVFTSLIGKGSASLWMIERPPFSRECAVILRCEIEYDPNDTPQAPVRKVKRTQWFVEHVAPKEMIWRWKPMEDRHNALDIRPTEDVERHHTYITEDFAKALQEAWLSTLELTRYAEHGLPTPDGTTLQFYCGGLFGQTRSPNAGLPAMLADLGRKLRSLALAGEKGREPLLAEADTLARKIAKEAEAEQIRLFGSKMSRFSLDRFLDRSDHSPQTGEGGTKTGKTGTGPAH